jgi:hypothetical protein
MEGRESKIACVATQTGELRAQMNRDAEGHAEREIKEESPAAGHYLRIIRNYDEDSSAPKDST